MVMVGVYIKKLIEDGALREDFTIELLGLYTLGECLEREKELAKTSLYPKGLNGNAGDAILMTDEVREKIRKNSKEQVKNKTHNFLGGDLQRKNAKERVENKTHHLLGGEITRRSNKERVENKTHHFLGGDLQRKNNKERVENNTHHLLGKGLMSVYDKEDQKIIRIHKDLYNQNRDRYLNLSSNEYKKIKAASIEAQTQIETENN